MRIHTRKEFLKLPPGVAYCKGKRWCFDGLNFKGDSLSNDWWSTDPAWIDGDSSDVCFRRLEEMLESGASYPIQEDQGRDGLFEEDDLFLVLEKDDLLKLRGWIDTVLKRIDFWAGLITAKQAGQKSSLSERRDD